MPPIEKRKQPEIQKQQDVPQVDRTRTIDFLKRKFSEYYSKTKLWFPDRLPEREWAFLYFDSKGGMHRPVAFRSENDAREFLASRSPAHVYYSSAYYEDPAVPMAEKKWLGAELIFDLDADHVKGAEKMGYEEQLAEVKKRFIYLIDEFLAKDFVGEKDIQIIFSGGRGYHAHIVGEKIIQLNSSERREIVDYITGTGIENSMLLKPKTYDVRQFGHHVKGQFAYALPEMEEPAWKGRIRRGIEELTAEWERMEKSEVIKRLTEYDGIGASRARKLYDDLLDEKKLESGTYRWRDKSGKVRTEKRDSIRGIDKLRTENNMQYGETSDEFVKLVMQSKGVPELVSAETDEPVTSDVKRIIRMPTSLHGKSGLATVQLTRQELEMFEPLRDAVPATYSDAQVKLNVLKPLSIRLKGAKFDFGAGAQEAPEFAAVFMACRGTAVVE